MGRLEEEGQVAQGRMARHRVKRLEADEALPYRGMTVLVGAERVHRVVEMDGAQTAQAHHAVELVKHAVEVVRDVVAGVPHMAGIQAHAEMVGELHAVDDGTQLLKGTADLGPLARHGLKQHRRGLLGGEDLVEHACDLLDTHLRTLAHVAAGMEVVHLVRRGLHANEVVGEGRAGKLLHLGLGRRRVERVRGMGEDGRDAVLGAIRVERLDVGRVDVLGLAAARVAREELERVGVDGNGIARHGKIAL